MMVGATVQAWWTAQEAGLIGGLAGGGLGLLGSLMGVAMGTLATRGKARAWVFGLQWVVIAAGAVSAVVGLYAVAAGQPYGVWFPLALCGVVSLSVFGGLLPVTRRVYRAADQRRLEAEALRRS